MTARLCFQLIVVPLAAFMLICGALLLGLAWFARLPITSPLPFIESQEMNRVAMGVVSTAFLLMAVGLLLKQKLAWYLLLGILAASVLVHLVGMWDSGIVGSYGVLGCILRAALSAIIGGFIYYGTRPAFSRE